MTSAELIGQFSGHFRVKGTEIDLDPAELYRAANLAQYDILNLLGVLERRGALTLAAGISEYAFSPVVITSATAATPIVCTAAAHPYNTGDYITIAGGLVMTAINGRFKVTKIDANTFSLDGSVGVGAYTASSATSYHDLLSAFRLKHVFRLESPFGELWIKGASEAEFYRPDFDTGSNNSSASIEDVVQVYQVFDEYGLHLFFQSTPTTLTKLGLIYNRRPLPSEKISSTVNPLVPEFYDHLLFQGTKYYVLQDHQNDIARDEAEKIFPIYQRELLKGKALNSKRRFINDTDPSGLKWGFGG